MQTSNENIFNLPTPDDWMCSMVRYTWSHSQLVFILQMADATHPLKLAFQSVEYFEGPMIWKGVNFRLGSTEEYLQLFHNTQEYHNTSSDFALTKRYKLYIVNLLSHPNSYVKIIAARGDVLTADEDNETP